MPKAQKVILATCLSDRLLKLEKGAAGNLLGLDHDGTLFVIGIEVLRPNPGNVSFNLMNLQVCGSFTIGNSVEETKSYYIEETKNAGLYESPLLLTSLDGNLQVYSLNNQKPSSITFTMWTNAQLASTLLYFRTKAEFILSAEYSQQSVVHSLMEKKKKILSEEVAFMLEEKGLLLMSSKRDGLTGLPGITAEKRVKDVFEALHEQGNNNFAVVPVQVHFRQTKDSKQTVTPSIAPLIRHSRKSFNDARVLVNIDVLAMVHFNAEVGTLFSAFKNSLLGGLTEVEVSLLHQLDTEQKEDLSSPDTVHFFPPQASHFVSVVYPRRASDHTLKKVREMLHHSLGFALDQPLFRRSQAYKFPGEGSSNSYLINPHEGLKSGVKGGQPSLVKGLYSYHHYMQDRFDDNGWGCAYRSLQTIVSWFRFQGFTEVEVPSHRKIQDCLYKIGDKPASFVGSRQWIGSTEVSFVLESLLGVSCRILTASTGEEVGSLGSELSYHFQTHGTPIMIGGGVLAHTIIGVDYNRSTGDIKFLILDPHYTGGEDIGIITGKGWVGWKDTKFWTKNAFYNLCLPLRPIGDI